MGLVLAFVYGIFIWHLSAASAYSQSAAASSWQTSDWFQLLEELGAVNTLEGAHAHGAWGGRIGVGASMHNIANGSPQHELFYKGGQDPSKAQKKFLMPRVYWLKGTPIGVDVGLNYGTTEDRMLSVAGGYLQWSILQQPALPALASRLSWTRLLGVESTSFTAAYPELVGSYSFLNYFEIYGGGGLSYREASYNSHQDEKLSLVADYLSPPASRSEVGISPFYRAGLQLSLGSPFFSLTAEYFSNSRNSAWSGKIAVGI